MGVLPSNIKEYLEGINNNIIISTTGTHEEGFIPVNRGSSAATVDLHCILHLPLKFRTPLGIAIAKYMTLLIIKIKI